MLKSVAGKAIMARVVLVVLAALSAVLVAGCSGQGDASKKNQAGSQKPKTVVVNQGMSKKEEDKLNQRLADLEDKVNNDQSSEEEQSTQETESAEDTARAAAQAYYSAAGTGNYSYTYNELSSYSRSQFSEDEWVAANTALGSDTASYGINSVNMVDDTTAEVNLTITSQDGSSSGRLTRFILENGSWKHDLTQEEYDLFAGATETAASASASASASANANTNTKHVKIVISSNKPADVSIYDDRFNWVLNEEIVGTKTYERDIPENSGLSVSAITAAYHAQTSIAVYEDGGLVSQDSDSHGNAIVTY
jgi:hypothetical protein